MARKLKIRDRHRTLYLPPLAGRTYTPIILGVVFLALASLPGLGQEKSEQEPPATIKVSTEVVSVYAVVEDKKKHLIPDLKKEDFELEEDGTPQEIRYFSREADTPITMGIMVDTSPSQGKVLGIEQEEAKAFLHQVMRVKDLAFVLHFDVDVELLQDFTADQRLLAHAIDETVINGGGHGVMPGPFPTSDSGGATHLYDAVYLASNELLKNEVGRKVLILLTDGEDQGSKVKLQTALEAAQKSDVINYSVAIIDRSFYWGHAIGFGGDSVLKKLSDDTGGSVLEVNRAKDTSAAFQQIARELRTQYLLGYTPTNTKHDGSYRKIRVQVRNGDYRVQARRGYYAPTE
ncbi:MAG: VWA domain-containing protein [Terriglobia bacterium]|jgi:VWFA-related protein